MSLQPLREKRILVFIADILNQFEKSDFVVALHRNSDNSRTRNSCHSKVRIEFVVEFAKCKFDEGKFAERDFAESGITASEICEILFAKIDLFKSKMPHIFCRILQSRENRCVVGLSLIHISEPTRPY